MKKLKLFFALFAMLALNVGNAWAVDYSATHTSNVTFTAGTNGSTAKVKINSIEYDAMKLGTSSKTGTMTFKIPVGTTKIHLHVAGWKSKNTKLNLSANNGVTLGTESITSTADNGVTSNSPFTLATPANATTSYYKVVEITSGATVAETTITIQTTSTGYRAVVWGVNAETESGDEGTEETLYSVTLQPATGGTIEADKDEAAAGATVTLTATPDADYKFSAWDVKDASNNAVAVTNNQFTMPAEDVTVSATFVEKAQYAITWSVNGEAKTLLPSSVAEGEAIGTLPKAENCPEGKVFVGWTIVSEHNDPTTPPSYIDENEVPTQNTTYYAVFATKETTTTVASEDYELKDITEIQPTDVVVVTMSKDGTTWALTSVNGSSSSPTAVSVTVSGNKLANAPDNALQWNISKDNSSLVLYPNGTTAKWLYCTSSNSGVRVGTNTNKTFTLDPTSGYLKHTGTSRYLGVYNGQDWRCYTNTTGNTAGQTLGFYVKSAGGTTIDKYTDYSLNCSAAEEPYLSIEDVTDNKIDFGSLFVENTLEKEFSINAAHLEDDITLTLSGDDCFTISTNSISKGEEFPQTVKVTYAPTASSTHSAELTITSGELSETITLTGQAETPTIYTLTDLANINAKDQVIIVAVTSDGKTYAMSNNNGTGSAPTAVAVEVSNDEIKTNDATIVWNLVKDDDNLIFYPNGDNAKWLYCTDTNNGVRVGTNTNKTFTIDATSGYLKHTGTNRYLGVYNSQDWRCYDNTTGNTKDQTFAFYVLPNTDPSINVDPESHDFVVVLNGSASKEVEITAHNIATPTYSVSISDNTHFTATVNASKVTITYAPTAAGEHTATLTITETSSSQTATVELTGKCVETMDVADAMATADNTEVALNPFEVVKVISDKNYVYIKDATGASMIFDYNNAHSMGSLVEGATVTGFVGKKSTYNKNPQLTPSIDYSSLSVSGSGTAEAIEITELKAEDVNKFVVLKGVEITSNVNISENPTFTVNGNNVVSYNQFGRNFDFQASMLYDIYGFVGIYNETVQFWFLQATSAGSAIEYYTVTYEKGANDVIGDAPVDTKEYAEGESVTLKTCELTREGYTFAGWDVTSTSGSVAVADNKFIMPASDVTVTALWKEIKTYDQGAWVLVTDAGDLAVNDDVIIAAANDNYALGTEQKSNNRGTGTIVKGSNVALLESNVQIITLESGNKPSTLAFYTGSGYLYAASSDNNYLRTENELSNNSSWAIEIEESVATIEAQGENTRNLLQYNSNNNKLFSCYSSKQAPVAIYEYHPNERVVTFDVNGGEAYDYTYFATTSGTLALPTAVPTHAAEGQLFDSWNDKQDGSGHTYNAGEIFSFSEHTVLYAQWTVADAYHVTYNIAGASGTTPVDANHYYGGENITLAPQGDLVNPGHIFAGWKVVDATDTEIMVTDNAFIMPQSDVTATAKWVRQTNDKWVLVTEDAQLVVGEKYVIACNTQGAVAGNINTSYMNKLDAAFSDDKQLIKALAPEAIVLTLGGTTDAWTFTNESGKALGATAAKNMAWGSGTTTWLLTFDANGALTMTNTNDSYGALQYNSQNPRFTTYTSGQKDIQLYILNPAQVVEGEKTDDDVPQYSNVTVEDGGDLSVENTDTQYGDMYINNGGSVEVDDDAKLTVNNLYIQTTMGTTTSGQLNTAPENLIVNGDAFIDITLGKNGDPSQWHAFTVPFPVDAMNGIFDLNDNKLTNGLNYAVMQYHGDVRAQGKYGWKKYSGVLVPGTFYLMTVDGARTTYRFKKVKDAALVAENTKSLSVYTGGGKTTDHGWNGVGNPTLMHGKVAFDAQILDPISYTYQVIAAASAHFTVGTPFFIQAATDATVTIAAEVSGSLAPARRAAAAVDKVKVMLGNADYTDYLYVSASEDATNEYEIGKDLAKMTMTNTPIVPQIFAQAYGTYLCMVNAPMTSNEATVALNLYAPAEGEYTLSVEEQANATVYLLYNGNIVWNLSMGEYPIHLTQGNNAGYSLVVRRENVPTDVENIFGADEQTEKFIYNGNLYILHEGKVFDAVGNVLK